MKKLRRTFCVILFVVFSQAHASASLPAGHFIIEGGAYNSTQGQSQHIAISGLIGDQYNVTHHHDWGSIAGMGYLFTGPQWDRVTLDYGMNVFYLSKTKVSGVIAQENLFTNMAFQYYANHLPLYAVVKALINIHHDDLAATFDFGAGPNFMETSQFTDSPLNVYSIPDNAFSGHHNTTFSAMIGIGLRYNIMKVLPVEISYRFFYLGTGYLNQTNGAVLNRLKTGNNYAQALLFTINI